jgi:hypothetical protein
VLGSTPPSDIVQYWNFAIAQIRHRVYGEVVGYGGEHDDCAEEEKGKDGEGYAEKPTTTHAQLLVREREGEPLHTSADDVH